MVHYTSGKCVERLGLLRVGALCYCTPLGAVLAQPPMCYTVPMLAADYPEDLLPQNVIVPLSEGTERATPYQSEGSAFSPPSGPHSGGAGHDTDLYDLFLVMTECRALLIEIRDLAVSVKIPAFLRGGKR